MDSFQVGDLKWGKGFGQTLKIVHQWDRINLFLIDDRSYMFAVKRPGDISFLHTIDDLRWR